VPGALRSIQVSCPGRTLHRHSAHPVVRLFKVDDGLRIVDLFPINDGRHVVYGYETEGRSVVSHLQIFEVFDNEQSLRSIKLLPVEIECN
jgi:hypothetical protein